MALDIGKELYEKIKEDFEKRYRNNKKIKEILEKIKQGTATHRDTQLYSKEVGECLSLSYKKYLITDNLPDGKLYWNIAESVIKPTLENNFDLVGKVAQEVQLILNKKYKIGLNPIEIKPNTNVIKSIMELASKGSTLELAKNQTAFATNPFAYDYNKAFEDNMSTLQRAVVTQTRKRADNFMKESARIYNDAGVSCVIARYTTNKCCEWCEERVGMYDYNKLDNTEIFRRHESCDCLIIFKEMKKLKIVKNYTKGLTKKQKEDINKRGQVIINKERLRQHNEDVQKKYR